MTRLRIAVVVLLGVTFIFGSAVTSGARGVVNVQRGLANLTITEGLNGSLDNVKFVTVDVIVPSGDKHCHYRFSGGLYDHGPHGRGAPASEHALAAGQYQFHFEVAEQDWGYKYDIVLDPDTVRTKNTTYKCSGASIDGVQL